MKRHHRFSRPCYLAALWASAIFLMLAAGPEPATAAEFEPVILETSSGQHRFETEVAATPAARSRGLMYRTVLPADKAMLFDFFEPRIVGMWMRNTRIPLDMVFIKNDGRIDRIEHMTTPFSERVISSSQAVRAVLELKGGTARKIGLKHGDRVRHRIFSNSKLK